MGTPAATLGDLITGLCVGHQTIGPLGVPVPAPPIPFSAPIALGIVPTVLFVGKPAAVAGANGLNTPPHVGLHGTDPFLVPTMQQGIVTVGSTSVLVGGLPAVRTGSVSTICFGLPGTVTGTALTVLIGG
jgi:uncharacterized Zn-binding protein involved in type VI secretion